MQYKVERNPFSGVVGLGLAALRAGSRAAAVTPRIVGLVPAWWGGHTATLPGPRSPG